MNQVINASVGATAFTFEVDAYDALDRYLASLSRYFAGSPDRAEIMHDIEARLAELFGGRSRRHAVLTLAAVEAAVATMGTPADFDPVFSPSTPSATTAMTRYDSRHPARRTRKKLMRDPDDKKLGGVCSGVAAYLGIDDPLWVRIAFVASVVTLGVPLVIYFLLWAIMPVARTAGDKLAMRGAPVDFDSIGRQIERDTYQVAGRLKEWGEGVAGTDWKRKLDGARRGWREANEADGPRPRRNADEEREAARDEGYMV